ncbi:fatty acid synthase-like [Vespula pensylvanica]|uniref:fatty acid synthase-like n=1 Tax=Vespula pensylvanica TaxID=30213 RepID=UPI001CBA2AEC|nr:fatty acid synthase-like [Vespula pensylvanica]
MKTPKNCTNSSNIQIQNQEDVFGITNCNRDMMAQNISYWLGVTGPSYNVDTGCSSTLYAMDQAYRAIRTGECDYAIVTGSNLCLHPYTSLHFVRLGVLNQDGRCKVFDEDANEFLQNAKTVRRINARIIHVKTNSCIPYIEAHNTRMKIEDSEELKSIDHISTKNKTNPLKIGSVNMTETSLEAETGIYVVKIQPDLLNRDNLYIFSK